MIEITRKFSFEAAHYLKNYVGKCSVIHGHSYYGEITVWRDMLENDMVMDFGEIKEILNPIIEYLDHKFLNDLPEFITQDSPNPTAERIAMLIFDAFNLELHISPANKKIMLKSVLLHETRDSYVRVSN